MKSRFIGIIILTSMVLSGCQDGVLFSDLLSESGQQANYPYTIYAKSPDEISLLQSEIDSLNENKICMELNQFGFSDHSSCREKPVDEYIEDQGKILSIVKSTLLKNSKFTNVHDTTNLNVRKITQLHKLPYHLVIYFENQFFDGLIMENSRIVVYFYGNYVYRIDGSWYPEISIPPEGFGYSVAMAKKKILGKKFEFICWSVHEITITPQLILDELTESCIYPLISDEKIELRVAYRFSIGQGNIQNGEFHIYVDKITGEIIAFIQLIAC